MRPFIMCAVESKGKFSLAVHGGVDMCGVRIVFNFFHYAFRRNHLTL